MSKLSEKKPTRAQLAEARSRAARALAKMTDEEDAAIAAAALADPDAQPIDDILRRRRGRPQAPPDQKKIALSIKLDPDAVAHFRSTGPGWQTQMNLALRRAAGLNS
jgi:uncharacterized protein (DUF4415 family)